MFDGFEVAGIALGEALVFDVVLVVLGYLSKLVTQSCEHNKIATRQHHTDC